MLKQGYGGADAPSLEHALEDCTAEMGGEAGSRRLAVMPPAIIEKRGRCAAWGLDDLVPACGSALTAPCPRGSDPRQLGLACHGLAMHACTACGSGQSSCSALHPRDARRYFVPAPSSQTDPSAMELVTQKDWQLLTSFHSVSELFSR